MLVNFGGFVYTVFGPSSDRAAEAQRTCNNYLAQLHRGRAQFDAPVCPTCGQTIGYAAIGPHTDINAMSLGALGRAAVAANRGWLAHMKGVGPRPVTDDFGRVIECAVEVKGGC